MNISAARVVWRGREVVVLPHQVRVYARKSVASEHSERSIEEQVAHGLQQAERLGLPIGEEDVRAEKPGHGGDEFWVGGGSMSRDVGGTKRRTRPVLTQLVEEIRNGLVKVLIVWDHTRLWRSVELCGALVDLLYQHGVILVDRNGFTDIETPEGRQMVNMMAAGAQHFREMCKVHSMRAQQAKRERGESAYGTRVLGYASRPGQGIVSIAEEIDLVRRIFSMFVHGENDSGPLSSYAIAGILTKEGCSFFAKMQPNKSEQGSPPYVYHASIRNLLRNPRYIGKQVHRGSARLYDAKEFLIDGQPAVGMALWSAAQARTLRNKTVPNRRIDAHPLSGWLRCGVCAKRFGPNQQVWTTGGVRKQAECWRVRSNRSFHECRDRPPAFQTQELDRFVKVHLAPLLALELRSRHREALGAGMEMQIAERRLRRKELDDKRKTDLPKLMREQWQKKPELVAALYDALEEEINSIDSEIVRLELRSGEMEGEILSLDRIATLSEAEYRETLRSVIKWAAVVPNDAPPERSPVSAKKTRSVVQGRVLFLTSWGTYHTAVIEYSAHAPQASCRRRTNKLRPASVEEELGSVRQLPEPQRFFENLRREQVQWRSRHAFHPEEWAPGYLSSEADLPIIEVPHFA